MDFVLPLPELTAAGVARVQASLADEARRDPTAWAASEGPVCQLSLQVLASLISRCGEKAVHDAIEAVGSEIVKERASMGLPTPTGAGSTHPAANVSFTADSCTSVVLRVKQRLQHFRPSHLGERPSTAGARFVSASQSHGRSNVGGGGGSRGNSDALSPLTDHSASRRSRDSQVDRLRATSSRRSKSPAFERTRSPGTPPYGSLSGRGGSGSADELDLGASGAPVPAGGSALRVRTTSMADSMRSFDSGSAGTKAPPRTAYSSHQLLVSEAFNDHRFRDEFAGRQITSTAKSEKHLADAKAMRAKAMRVGNRYSKHNSKKSKSKPRREGEGGQGDGGAVGRAGH